MADRAPGPGYHLSNSPPPPQASGWELDRRIPALALLGLLAYGVTGIWYVAGQAGQIATAERRIVTLEENNKEFSHTVGAINDKLGTMNSAINDKLGSMNSAINDKLGTMNEAAARNDARAQYILDRLQIPASTPVPASRTGGANR